MNSLLAIFDEIWSKTVYYIVQGHWSDFLANLKIHKKSNFNQNQLKLSMLNKSMYLYQKKIIKVVNFLLAILMKFGRRPCTIVQGLWSDF